MSDIWRKKIFLEIRKKPGKQAEKVAFEAEKAVFEHTDCLGCARCCKGYNAILEEEDVIRISAHLKLEPHQFAATYMMVDEDDEWCLNGSPCPFLQADNKCSIYPVRPASCADYPHMGSPGLVNREELTLINADICPAVDEILLQIEKKLQDL